MNKTIVTSGQPFTDIDAFACAVAYAELLRHAGKDADAVLPGPLNKSVVKAIKKWNLKYSTSYQSHYSDDNKYVLVDISDPKFFADFVKEKYVVDVFDHRYGFEDYWNEKLGFNSHIEMVGACATLIWEEFVKRKQDILISSESANLLYTAIASNTLNFKASVTTERDKKAFDKLSNFTELPSNWIEKYFIDQDKEVESEIKTAILNDTKDMSPYIGQLEMWDSKKIVLDHLSEIRDALESFGSSEWFLTAPSISEGINYIYTKNSKYKKLLEKTINTKFVGDIGTTDKLWLRKEIYKEISPYL